MTASDRLRVTEAGRRLHDSRHGVDCWQAAEGCALIDLIAAVEAEARTSSLDEGAPDRRWLPAALNEIEAKVRELADEAPASYVKAILAAIEEVRFSDAMLARIEEVRR